MTATWSILTKTDLPLSTPKSDVRGSMGSAWKRTGSLPTMGSKPVRQQTTHLRSLDQLESVHNSGRWFRVVLCGYRAI